MYVCFFIFQFAYKHPDTSVAMIEFSMGSHVNNEKTSENGDKVIEMENKQGKR